MVDRVTVRARECPVCDDVVLEDELDVDVDVLGHHRPIRPRWGCILDLDLDLERASSDYLGRPDGRLPADRRRLLPRNVTTEYRTLDLG